MSEFEDDSRIMIKVKPSGKMVMLQVDIMAKAINMIHLPEEARYGEVLRRAKVLAIGPDCSIYKPGDKVYFTTAANAIEVEHFYRKRIGEKEGGQVYLVYEDNIPAGYELASDNDTGLDVVPGLSDEGHKKARDEAQAAGERNADAARSSQKIYRPVR